MMLCGIAGTLEQSHLHYVLWYEGPDVTLKQLKLTRRCQGDASRTAPGSDEKFVCMPMMILDQLSKRSCSEILRKGLPTVQNATRKSRPDSTSCRRSVGAQNPHTCIPHLHRWGPQQAERFGRTSESHCCNWMTWRRPQSGSEDRPDRFTKERMRSFL